MESFITTHTTANLEIDFEKRRLWGNVVLLLKSLTDKEAEEVILDTRFVVSLLPAFVLGTWGSADVGVATSTSRMSRSMASLRSGILLPVRSRMAALCRSSWGRVSRRTSRLLSMYVWSGSLVFVARLTYFQISLSTTEQCTALQWMTPAQTSNKKHPYMCMYCFSSKSALC